MEFKILKVLIYFDDSFILNFIRMNQSYFIIHTKISHFTNEKISFFSKKFLIDSLKNLIRILMLNH